MNSFDLDKKLVYSLAKSKIPNPKQLKYLGKFLNRRERWVVAASLVVFLASFSFLSAKFCLTHFKPAPARGGEYVEGVVGMPKYINPLYAAFSDVDSDLASLIFSSLLRRDKDGRLQNDLAESYEISVDGKTYIFQIRKDVKWHNGSPLTADDILFTFNAIKDGQYKSPLRDGFRGVEAEKVDENKIKFVLTTTYAAFAELLTFGVMPQDLWYQISPASAPLAELNLKPVGSGFYKFKSLVKDKSGQIKSYSLTVNDDYYGLKPYIADLIFKFFASPEEAVEALNKNNVDGLGYLPRQLAGDLVSKNYLSFHELNFPQLISLFFNQKNNKALADKKTRQALAFAINKDEIINNVLGGKARIIDGPLPPDNFAYNPDNKKYAYSSAAAVKLLEEAGWKAVEITEADLAKAEEEKSGNDEKVKKEAEQKIKMGAGRWLRRDGEYLAIKITAADSAESRAVAEAIKKNWLAAGIKAETELLPAAGIGAGVIKPRDFEALLYGQVVGADPDIYFFWHSSQTGENGLNISNYSNREVDKLLEEGRLSLNSEERKGEYQKIQEIITEEMPAVFLYSPFYAYVQSKKIKGFDATTIFSPRDRFAGARDWYVKTKKKLVW